MLALLVFLSVGSGACSGTSTSTTDTDGTPSEFILPVDGDFSSIRITDSFGPRILHGVYDFHRGLDIDLELNDSIYAAADGVVIHAGSRDDYPRSGNFIVLEHANQQFTGYLHLNAIADGLEAGDIVTQGDLIAYAGDTGEGNVGVHLHFNYYISDNTGEIPSSTNDTFPPLEIFDYPDTDDHSVTITDVDASSADNISVQLAVSVPSEEMDLNEVRLEISDAVGTSLYSRIINYADRTNCGTDEPEVNNILIVPEDFQSSQSTYDLDFTFGAIDLSTESGTLTITATAIDIRGNEQSDSTELTL